MRYYLIAGLMMLGGCGGMESYDNARSVSEAMYFLERDNGRLDKDTVGENPYDNDPRYKMVYCQVGDLQYWSTVANCTEADGKPQT